MSVWQLAGYGHWVLMPALPAGLQNAHKYAFPARAGGERIRQAQPLAISQAGGWFLLPLFLVEDVSTGSIKCGDQALPAER